MEDNYLIQELIERKNFAELTIEERKMVLKEITQEEYESRRVIVVNTRDFLHEGVREVAVSADIKRRVAMLMQMKKHENKGLFTYRIPAYMAVAAILCILFMMPLFYADDKPPHKKLAAADTVYKNSQPEIVYVHDTLIKEKEKIRYVNVPVIKYVNTIEANNANVSLIEVPSGGIVPTVSFAKEQLQEQLKNIGKSSSEQEELNKFLVISQ